jgi:hypothetical protein
VSTTVGGDSADIGRPLTCGNVQPNSPSGLLTGFGLLARGCPSTSRVHSESLPQNSARGRCSIVAPSAALFHCLYFRSRWDQGSLPTMQANVPATGTGKTRAWIDNHWRSVLFGVTGFLVGGVTGWWAGSATACVNCQANTAGIEALGTWVGGLGTVAAVAFAVIAFRSEEQSRRDMERQLLTNRREQDEHDRKEAQDVTISFTTGATIGGDRATELRVTVRNGTSTSDVYRLSGNHDDFGTIGFKHTLKPGETHLQRYLFGMNL